MKAWALPGCFASAGMASVSNQMIVPSFGIEYLITSFCAASAAWVCACLMSPLQPAALQISPVAVERWLARGRARHRGTLVAAAIAANAAFSIGIAMPVWPLDRLPSTPQAAINYDGLATVGWPQLVRTVAEVRDTLPDGANATILTGNYGEAGAIDRFGSYYATA